MLPDVGNYIVLYPITLYSLPHVSHTLRNITLITIIILVVPNLAQLLRRALNPSEFIIAEITNWAVSLTMGTASPY